VGLNDLANSQPRRPTSEAAVVYRSQPRVVLLCDASEPSQSDAADGLGSHVDGLYDNLALLARQLATLIGASL